MLNQVEKQISQVVTSIIKKYGSYCRKFSDKQLSKKLPTGNHYQKWWILTLNKDRSFAHLMWELEDAVAAIDPTFTVRLHTNNFGFRSIKVHKPS